MKEENFPTQRREVAKTLRVRNLKTEGFLDSILAALRLCVYNSFFVNELRAFTDYRRLAPLSYWRSASGFEVDFILDDRIAIEIKAAANPSARHLKGLNALREDSRFEHYLLVCLVDRPRDAAGIRILPWKQFLTGLWGGDYDGSRGLTPDGRLNIDL